jgi:hypothetical protein
LAVLLDTGILYEALGLARVATTDRRDFTPLAASLSLELLP